MQTDEDEDDRGELSTGREWLCTDETSFNALLQLNS